MISHFRSVRELGLFSALGYVIMVGTMIIGALGQSAIPRLALYASQSKTGEFRRLSNRLLLIGMALGLLGVLTALAFGRQLIAAIYGSEYAQNLQVLVWLTVAAACGYMASFGGCCLTAARHFRIQLPLFTVVTGLTIVLCYVAVRDSGALGAAKVLAIVAFVQLVATLAIVRRLEGSRPPNTL
jgi:O-antigen/teichoic acid export membrane protein